MSFDWHGLEPYTTITLPDRWPWEKAMTREELIEKMLDAFDDNDYAKAVHHTRKRMAAALDVAVGELLAPSQFHRHGTEGVAHANEVLDWRRHFYLPKSDPAVEAARKAFDEVWCNELCRGVSPEKACAPSLGCGSCGFQKGRCKMNEFEQLLFAADRNITAIRELKEVRETLAFMTGVAVGAIGTLTTIAAVWGIVRLIQWI